MSTLVELASETLAGGDRPLLAERDAAGAWSALGSREVLRRAAAVAGGLRSRGLAPGQRVGLFSPNRVDWIVANLGILFAGCVAVPIYANQALDQVAYIVEHADVRLVFVAGSGDAGRLRDAGIAVPAVAFDGDGPDAFAALLGAPEIAVTATPAPGDLAVLIYTSGTTGPPKGVMLTHHNLAWTVRTAYALTADRLGRGDAVLSVLPFAHVYEYVNLFGYFLRGAIVYVNRRIEALLDDLRSVRPVVMFGVPRIFERTHGAVLTRARSAGGIRAWLVPWALATGARYRRTIDAALRPNLRLRAAYALARATVLRRLRRDLGCDRLHFFGSGSAALHPDIAYAFAGAGITIVEGYGLTECAPVVSANDVERPRIGTVGRPLPGVDVTVAPDGELLVRGPNVMRGYYRDDAATAAAIRDGWFATGDVVERDAEGYLRIVDRKSEIFETSGGNFIAPARIESALLRSPLVAQAVVIGAGRAHPAALISPNWRALRAELGADDLDGATAANRADVLAIVARACADETADLAPFERIRWVGVLPRDLTVDDGELTPTLKVKRRTVEQRYATLIAEYAPSP